MSALKAIFSFPKATHSYAGHAIPHTKLMSFEDWAAIPINPRQRDTSSRVKKSISEDGHLRLPKITHTIVTAAELPDGSMFKLDGHTRTELWLAGHVARPEVVLVNIVQVNDMDEVREYYTHYDSDKAVESTSDKISGAARERNVLFASSFCLGRKFANAMRYAHGDSGKYSVYDAFDNWKSEIKHLDALHVSSNKFNSGITLAFLLTVRRNPSIALDMWRRFAAGDQIKDDSTRKMRFDIVGIIRVISEHVMNDLSFGGGRDRQFAVAQRVIWAFERYLEDPTRKFSPVAIHQIPVSDYRAILKGI